jgi:hypothetical protein
MYQYTTKITIYVGRRIDGWFERWIGRWVGGYMGKWVGGWIDR